jgi:hypothetical protein
MDTICRSGTLMCSVSNHYRHKIRITADKKRDRPSREITWTTKAPATRKRGPEDIMSKPEKISDEALAAQSAGDMWSIFFTEEMLRIIVDCTNEKIEESFLKNDYSEERLRKSPYIAQTDMVIFYSSVLVQLIRALI